MYENNILAENEKISSRLRVRSIHAAQSIDIVSVLTKVFGSMSDMPAVRHMFGKTSVIVQLPFAIHDKSSSSSSKDDNIKTDAFFYPQSQQPRFVAIFRFGSIVLFNVSPKDAGFIVEQVKKHGSNPFARSFERKEHFEVAVSPQMEQDAHVTSDFAMVKELNINNVAVISTIMAQTVAFDSYNDVVDEMLATFDEINSTVKKTGNFTAMQKETLFKGKIRYERISRPWLYSIHYHPSSCSSKCNAQHYRKKLLRKITLFSLTWLRSWESKIEAILLGI